MIDHITRIATILATLGCLTLQAVGEPSPQAPHKPRNLAILVFEGVELLDFAGPAEVFSLARDNDKLFFNVYLVAAKAGEVNTAQSVTLQVKHAIDDCPQPDILVIPGGETGAIDDHIRQWIRTMDKRTEITMSVCNGAFVLAELGLLDGLEVTTYWSFTKWLQQDVPTARVRNDVRVCDNGHIVTTAGISAGIDGSLHLVERLCGEDIAFATARGMEYDWHPMPLDEAAPGTALRSLARRAARASAYGQWTEAAEACEALLKADPARPRVARQWGEALLRLEREQDAVAAYERAIEQDESDAFVWDRLGRLHKKHGRHAQSARCFEQAIAHGWDFPNVRARLAAARNLNGETDLAIEALQAALAMKWGDMPNLLLVPDYASLHGDERFRAMMRDRAPAGSIQIAMADEPGEQLVISGLVVDAQDQPVADALVAAYHADAAGKYTAQDNETTMDEPHSRIFGFVRTSADGTFQITTIRPGGYPFARRIDGSERFIPCHVHLDVTAAGQQSIRKQMIFADDPRLDAHWRSWATDFAQPIADPKKQTDGSWNCSVTLTLRATNVP